MVYRTNDMEISRNGNPFIQEVEKRREIYNRNTKIVYVKKCKKFFLLTTLRPTHTRLRFLVKPLFTITENYIFALYRNKSRKLRKELLQKIIRHVLRTRITQFT